MHADMIAGVLSSSYSTQTGLGESESL
jgi:hypothetical protein